MGHIIKKYHLENKAFCLNPRKYLAVFAVITLMTFFCGCEMKRERQTVVHTDRGDIVLWNYGYNASTEDLCMHDDYASESGRYRVSGYRSNHSYELTERHKWRGSCFRPCEGRCPGKTGYVRHHDDEVSEVYATPVEPPAWANSE
jgi:hypothetical protein